MKLFLFEKLILCGNTYPFGGKLVLLKNLNFDPNPSLEVPLAEQEADEQKGEEEGEEGEAQDRQGDRQVGD